MPPDERENFITNKPAEVRQRILAKVAEYEALGPDERELRLRATELRWYLLPLMREAPTNRDARLAQVPADMRGLVKSRLDQWIILPPPLQEEFLDDERAMRYFSHVESTNGPPPDYGWHHGQSNLDTARWNAMPEEERGKITARVNQFFELTPVEKEETLNTLSDAERRQMQKTLESFDKLPPLQRTECIHAFAKFAGMGAAQQREFLKNAESWSKMSPADRQAWRDLVTHVPEWPPLPPDFNAPPAPAMPPMPQVMRPVVATNRD